MKTLNAKTKRIEVNPRGNWVTAKNFFPEINVDQETGEVEVSVFYTSGRQDAATIETVPVDIKASQDLSQMLITGEVVCKNWKNYKCSGAQSFCYAVFEGDSGHIYVHRAPATKGWVKCNPNDIRKRLIKLGAGAVTGVLQQGDFLLKPAKSNSQPVDSFLHEWNSSSHHKFDQPVLSQYVSRIGRIVYIPEGKTVELHHEAIDGIQHPTVIVPSGQWVIGSTASQLSHANRRD